MKKIEPINGSKTDFARVLGIDCRPELMETFRELRLVRWFKRGKKFFYRLEDAEILSQKLYKGEISIESNDHIRILDKPLVDKQFK